MEAVWKYIYPIIETIWNYLPTIFGSSIIVAIFNQWINSRRNKKEAIDKKKSLLNGLIREISHAQWTTNYNYKRIERDNFNNNALALIKIKNIEEVLLVNPQTLPLNESILNELQDYLQEITYLNSQIEEYRMIIASAQTNERRNQIKYTLGEIQATCTPEDITTGSKTKSIAKITKDLLANLSKIEIK
jgi:hypothetical protein